MFAIAQVTFATKRTLLATFIALSLIGCGQDPPLDVRPTGTVGEEIFLVFCNRVASESDPTDVSGRRARPICAGEVEAKDVTDPRLSALVARRTALVRALDFAFEPPKDDLRTFLGQVTGLYDPPEELLPKQTRALADALFAGLNDPDFLTGLERLGARTGYRESSRALGALRSMLTHDDLTGVGDALIDSIESHDEAKGAWDALLQILALEMATFDADNEAEGSSLPALRELLLRTDPAFAPDDAPPIWVVLRDRRGLAMVAERTGALPAPFVDTDLDGFADADRLGRFVDPSGDPIRAPSPFATTGDDERHRRDEHGRALGEDDEPLYAYLDANQTLLAALLREGHALLSGNDPALMNLLRGGPPLLGPDHERRVSYGGTRVSYRAPDTVKGPLFAFIGAFGALVDRPELDQALHALVVLLRDHESLVAELVELLFDVVDAVDDYDKGNLTEDSPVMDDLLLVGARMARAKGMFAAILHAMADPHFRRLGAINAEMMRYRDPVSYDESDINHHLLEQTWEREVDRRRPDVVSNRSIFQRSLSLMHDLNGVPMCNKHGAVINLPPLSWPRAVLDDDAPDGRRNYYVECELLRVPNMTTFYARAGIGRAEAILDDRLLTGLLDRTGLSADEIFEENSGIDGLTTRPTPEALARLMFTPPNDFIENLMDPVLTRDGVTVLERHRQTIFAWEREYTFDDQEEPKTSSFRLAMAPMVRAFDDHDPQDGGSYLLGELFATLHQHWPSREARGDDAHTQWEDRDAPFYAYSSDVRSYEPLLIELFEDVRLTERLHRLAVKLDGVEIREDYDALDAFGALVEVTLDPELHPRLTNRQGSLHTASRDGTREAKITPASLIVEGLRALEDELEENRERKDAFEDGLDRATDRLFERRRDGEGLVLENQRARFIAIHLIEWLRERIAAHATKSDLEQWGEGLVADADETLGSPIATALAQTLDETQRTATVTTKVGALLSYATDPRAADGAVFASTLASAVDLLFLLEDEQAFAPVLRGLSEAVIKNARAATRSAYSLDADESGPTLLLRVLQEADRASSKGGLHAALGNLATPMGDGEPTPIEVIVDAIADVNRTAPGAGGALSREDNRAVLYSIYDFLESDERGLDRLYRVIQHRDGDPELGENDSGTDTREAR